ncbi:YceD family protein [Melghirimyces algeriensis]|uniref:DUF177 domain-containing protein n=1 Tax=Melghirimyces algeriensis TaxID=910412 RepID=A0A521BIK8_9BACL|nr:DUF177 domain-containing protein [Melghirimyces algeriensis]SMO46520.1 uncharacterized protein SAMN06264849_102102 [Melghirimyces algeriensis]
MLFRFRELQEQTSPVELEGEVKLEGLEEENADLVSILPVQVSIVAWKERPLFHMQGQQFAEGIFRCSRCLTTYEDSISSDWHELFTDQEDRMERSKEEEEIHLIRLDQLTDLTPFIRESLLLNIPLAPVCREDCKGLCPSCGTNWNEKACGCDNRKIDPRLAGLEKLLKRDD